MRQKQDVARHRTDDIVFSSTPLLKRNAFDAKISVKVQSTHFHFMSFLIHVEFVPSRSLVPSFVHSFVRSSVHPFVCLLVRSFVRSSVRPFVRSFVHSFVRWLVGSFVRSLISSFVCSFSFCFLFRSDFLNIHKFA